MTDKNNKNILTALEECRKIKPDQRWQIDTRNNIINYTQGNPQLSGLIFGIINKYNNIKSFSSFASLLFVVFFSFLISPYLTQNIDEKDLSTILDNTEIKEADIGIASFVLYPTKQRYNTQENDYSTIVQPNIESANDSFQKYINRINQLSNTNSKEKQNEIIGKVSEEASDLSTFMGLVGVSDSTAFEYAFRMTIAKKLEHCTDKSLRDNAKKELELGNIKGLIQANEYVVQCLILSQQQTL